MTASLLQNVLDIIRPFSDEDRYRDAYDAVTRTFAHNGYDAAVDKAVSIAEAYEDIRALREERQKEFA